MTRNVRIMTDAAPGAFMRMLGFVGTAKDNMQAYLFEVLAPGRFKTFNLPPGETILTIGHLAYDILASRNDGSSSVAIPTMASLGITYDVNSPIELRFRVQQRGNGLVFINAATDSGVVIHANNLQPETLPKFSVITCSSVGPDEYVLS